MASSVLPEPVRKRFARNLVKPSQRQSLLRFLGRRGVAAFFSRLEPFSNHGVRVFKFKGVDVAIKRIWGTRSCTAMNLKK